MILEDAYVKQSFSLTWAFFTENKKASFFVVAILLILSLLSTIPKFGLLVLLLLSVLSFSIQTYVSKSLYSKSEEVSFSELLLKYFTLSVGAFLGQVVIELLLVGLLFFALSTLVGMDVVEALRAGTLAQNQIFPVYMKLGFIAAIYFLVIMLWIYIVPMMLAYAYEAQSAMEAFLAAFVLFSPAVWKASFKEKYYVLISMLQVVAILVLASMTLVLSNIYLIPVALFFIYIFLVYVAIVSSMAKLAVL